MSGTRKVRIVDWDDSCAGEPLEVLCETESTVVLTNPAARARRDAAALLETQTPEIRAELARQAREVDAPR